MMGLLKYLAVFGLLAALVAACSTNAPTLQQCPPNPEPEARDFVSIPPAFEAEFPKGTHQREILELQPVFSRKSAENEDLYRRAYRANPCLRGAIHFAIALRPDGSVAGVRIIRSTANDAAYEAKLSELISSLQFGPAQGSGYYVFAYPIITWGPRWGKSDSSIPAALSIPGCPSLEYPEAALEKCNFGTTEIRVRLSATGSVTDKRVEKRSVARVLDDAALQHVASCHFEPAMEDGVGKEVWATRTYKWKAPEGCRPQ